MAQILTESELESVPTESQIIAERARMDYEAMSPEAKAEVDAAYEKMPEWRRQEIRDEIEMDLL